jgi:hypothetical protein
LKWSKVLPSLPVVRPPGVAVSIEPVPVLALDDVGLPEPVVADVEPPEPPLVAVEQSPVVFGWTGSAHADRASVAATIRVGVAHFMVVSFMA